MNSIQTEKEIIDEKLDMWNTWLKKEGIGRKKRLYELKRMKKDLKNLNKILKNVQLPMVSQENINEVV